MESQMDHEEAETAPIKYVFLDVVGFTKDRSTEAQVDIIKALNAIVQSAVDSFRLPENDVIFLPTGDGMCIALVSVFKPYDVHVLLALKILEGIKTHNDGTADDRQFSVRIGLNECDDTLVTDVNGNRNVAGVGINTAIMGLADASQILMSVSVFEKICGREKYQGRLDGHTGKVKHGNFIKCYQLKDNQMACLNCGTPSSFQVLAPPEPKLTLQMAFFMSLCFKYRIEIGEILKTESVSDEEVAVAVLWFMADDLAGEATAKPFESPVITVKEREEPLPTLIKRYKGGHYWFDVKLADYIQELYFTPYSKCFEEGSYEMKILLLSCKRHPEHRLKA